MAGQSRAYGFTLVIWSTALLAIDQNGLPGTLDIVLYVLGALTALTVVIVVAFGPWRFRYAPGNEPRRHPLGMLHLPSIVLGVTAGWVVTHRLAGHDAFYVAPLAAVLLFELVLALEIMTTTRLNIDE